MNRTLVVAECDANRLARVSLEAITAAGRLGEPISVVLLGDSGVGECANGLQDLDVDEIVRLEHEALGVYTPDGFASALSDFVTRTEPTYVVLPHTYRSRDLVPALANRLGRPAATDCTRLELINDRVVLTRPMFRGKVEADIQFDGPPPHLITIQAGAFRADGAPRRSAGSAPIRTEAAHLDAAAIRQRPEPPFREARQQVDLGGAERIVAVGRGIKSQEHIALAEQLATALDAELAASRPICDAGWLPPDRQVGSSGQTVAPQLYVALGISGAIQHVVGMKGARTVVAINTDPDAPIFEIADYGVVGDVFEVVPALVEALGKPVPGV